MNQRESKVTLTVLSFVAHYKGTRHKAFPWGYGYNFDAPSVTRAPFRQRSLENAIHLGLVGVDADETLRLTDKGREQLQSLSLKLQGAN